MPSPRQKSRKRLEENSPPLSECRRRTGNQIVCRTEPPDTGGQWRNWPRPGPGGVRQSGSGSGGGGSSGGGSDGGTDGGCGGSGGGGGGSGASGGRGSSGA
ncbi:unnamed protein product [Closterium sp. NIES-54]